MELIPYVGPILGAMPPVLVAFFGDPLTGLWVALLFVALQQIEGHVVAPTIFGHTLRINPLFVIFALLLGAEVYGIVGALVALPILSVVRETIAYLAEHLELEPWGTQEPVGLLTAGRVGRGFRHDHVPRVRRAGVGERHVLPALRRAAGTLPRRLEHLREAATMRLRSNPVPRIRLEDGPTAIRPSSPDDLTDLVALRVANRAHTGPWEPVRDASFYTAAGQRLELDLDARAWASGSAYPFSVLDAGDGDRLIGRVALANVVRGAWQNATLGYWIDGAVRRAWPRDAGGRPRAAVRLRARQPAPRAARGHPPQRRLAAGRRAQRLPPRGPRRALPAHQRRVGGPRHLRADRRGVAERGD